MSDRPSEPRGPEASAERRWLTLAALIVAGEAVFALPFHIARFYRPTMLEAFGLDNTQLGEIQAVYGVVAMLAYFPGGLLADRYPARTLLALSLWSTAAGGLYLGTFPGVVGLRFLWGLFGLTSILLLWAALIRATRDWGGRDRQGRAFGLLDAGRGALAALLASGGALLFTVLLGEQGGEDFESRRRALFWVIQAYTGVTFAAGLLVWFALPHSSGGGSPSYRTPDRTGDRAAVRAAHRGRKLTLRDELAPVLRSPAVWAIAVIVICAYVGYKGFDNYSLYAVQVFGWSEAEAARLTALAAWVRPLAAVGAGWLGDRFLVSRMTVLLFALLLACQLLFALLTPAPGLGWLLLANVLATSVAMFGLRALYFALFEEARVPAAVTGAAVGFVSVLGYTPDIFVAWVGGVLLDRTPGLAGHQHYFWFLAAFAALGLVTSLALHGRLRRASSAVAERRVLE